MEATRSRPGPADSLSLQEVADLAGCDYNTVAAAMERGELRVESAKASGEEGRGRGRPREYEVEPEEAARYARSRAGLPAEELAEIPDIYVTVREAARIAGRSRSIIRHAYQSGRIAHRTIGSVAGKRGLAVLIHVPSLAQYIAARGRGDKSRRPTRLQLDLLQRDYALALVPIGPLPSAPRPGPDAEKGPGT